MSEPTIRERVITALLDGQHIVAAQFAREIGSSANRVTRNLRLLGNMVRRVERFEGRGKHCCEYSAVNVEALKAELERDVYAREAGNGRPRLRFDELLEAWGIATRPVRIKLPRFRHRLLDSDDELEAA
ncbi:hypothetical protein N6G05_00015 [Cupriavidus gilardii]|uniref:hypothetical protein n=1 Tax=Cupriavidus gilardii TaxID=82541 RepID=UPI0021BF5138|nr:hypothetical protein [Cupriavidus gilardii]MCT9011946.1 hypothetical protein [Cupriavidus gilardii]MCT9053917.1 hypothetical protein [Cupriavidus gilardii]